MRAPRAIHGVAALLCMAACDVTSDLPAAYQNDVAIGNQPNSFAFSVAATALTMAETYDLAFDSDSTTVAVSVVGYAGGSGTLELLDDDGATIFSRSLAANTAEGASDVRAGRPARARLTFSNYSGLVGLGVSAD